MTDIAVFIILLVFLAGYIIGLYLRWGKSSKLQLRKIEESRLQIIQLEKMASLGTLSAGIAHEINNPLTFLITNLDLISHYTKDIGQAQDLDNRQKKMDDIIISVQECLDGANRIKRIVQDLLAFSHSSQGQFAQVDVNELLDTTVRILWNEIKYKADIARDYQAVTRIWLDPNQMSQVFLNLIINASHAIKSDTAASRGTIYLATREDEKYIIISVADTGKGIPEQHLRKIFEPFFTTSGGTGLGLYVSRKIVASHEGSIEAVNGSKGGAVLTVKLPKKVQKDL